MADKVEDPTVEVLRARAKTNSALGGNWQHINVHLHRRWITAKATPSTVESWWKGKLQGTLLNVEAE